MDTNVSQSVFPRVVRWLAIALALATVLLLILGALTTSFRAGMADPVWPTEPWFLIVNGHRYDLEQHRGFLLEHTHRAAGFTVGILASVLAISVWWVGQNRKQRWLGLAAISLVLVNYGGFHRQMGEAWQARQAASRTQSLGLPSATVEVFPVVSGYATAASAAILLAACAMHLLGQQPGRKVRALTGAILVGVMIQGLLGGYRVYLDQLYGLQLSQIHGTFAQIVFSAICCLPLLMAPSRPERLLLPADRAPLGTLSLVLPGTVLVQLIWGVMVRHTGSPLAQRLHILTAFVVVAVAVWLTVRVRQSASARRVLGFACSHVLLILVVQLALGVEAWLGKFAAFGPQGNLPPAAREVTSMSAGIRSLHVLIGTALLASAVIIAVRTWRINELTFTAVVETDSNFRQESDKSRYWNAEPALFPTMSAKSAIPT